MSKCQFSEWNLTSSTPSPFPAVWTVQECENLSCPAAWDIGSSGSSPRFALFRSGYHPSWEEIEPRLPISLLFCQKWPQKLQPQKSVLVKVQPKQMHLLKTLWLWRLYTQKYLVEFSHLNSLFFGWLSNLSDRYLLFEKYIIQISNLYLAVTIVLINMDSPEHDGLMSCSSVQQVVCNISLSGLWSKFSFGPLLLLLDREQC